MPPTGPVVVAVSLNPKHTFSKHPQVSIELLTGLGVAGDAHCGATVRHRYLRRRDPHQPNRTQVHLFSIELLGDLHRLGFDLQPGEIGENITTSGIDLLRLPAATRLHLGPIAVVELTGLRTPCVQMNRLRPGLMAATLPKQPAQTPTARAGVMATVLQGGSVASGCAIAIELPPAPHRSLRCV